MKKNVLIIIFACALANSASFANFPAAAAAGAGAAHKQARAKKDDEQPFNQLKNWYRTNFTQLGDQIQLLSYIEGLIRFNHLKIGKAHLKEAGIDYQGCPIDSEIIKLNQQLAQQATAINKTHTKEGKKEQVLKSFFGIMQKDLGINLPVTQEMSRTLILNIYSIDLLETLKKIIEKDIEPHEA